MRAPAQFGAQFGAIFFDSYRRHHARRYIEDLEIHTPVLPGDEDKKEVAAAGRSAEEVSAEAWGNYLQRDRSVVVDTFQGQLKSSVRCKECGFTNTKFDPFMYLSLPLPKAAAAGAASDLELAHCLEEFMAEETLDEDNLWRCPRCADFKPAAKQFSLWKLPPHLVVHLKRFGGSGSGRQMRKRSEAVHLGSGSETGLGLDLSPFVGSEQRVPPKYELYAACNHMGSLTSGHYVACVKHRDGNWWLCNDGRVTPMAASQVVSEDNYMLFFRRVQAMRAPRQSFSNPSNWPFRLSIIPDQFKQQMDELRRSRQQSSRSVLGGSSRSLMSKRRSSSGVSPERQRA